VIGRKSELRFSKPNTLAPLADHEGTTAFVDTSAFGVTDPFYQRAYVWTKEEQWEPLWNDVVGLDSFETATWLWLKNKLKSITLPTLRESMLCSPDYR
jgi:hypothetical protein